MTQNQETQQPRNPATQKTLNLALQGGGSHGAYSWGVLERLLEESDLVIEGVTGTSAGAMNAAVMVNGYATGGREGAKEKLAEFWRAVSEAGRFSPLTLLPFQQYVTGWNLDYSPGYYWLDLMSRLFSPYNLNPFNFNPLRGVLEKILDLDALRSCSDIKLFIAATHIETGQARVFDCSEMSVEAILASACIPFMFQAVEVDGEYYWDGGYMGNPAIWPLIYHCDCDDILLVQINPIVREGVPKQSLEIINRLNEISFNSSLIAEMRAIDFASRLIHQHKLAEDRYKDVRMHLIYSPEEMKALNASSKMNAGWDFLQYLREAGRVAADRFLEAHWDDIGVRASVDIREKFLTGPGKRMDVSELIRQKSERKKQREAAKPVEP